MSGKRAIIETINDELKNIAQIEHSRHRAFHNFVVNLLSGIAAYCFFPKKPTINLEKVVDRQLTLFMLFPVKKQDAAGFFNLSNALHEKTSIIITTNKAPTEWAPPPDDEVLQPGSTFIETTRL